MVPKERSHEIRSTDQKDTFPGYDQTEYGVLFDLNENRAGCIIL